MAPTGTSWNSTGYGDLIATNMTRITNAGGIALDTLGNIYVTTSNTVFKITPAGVSNVIATFSYTNTLLQGIVVKRSGPNAGMLAVCDSGRNGVYLIDPGTGSVTTNAGFNGPGDGTGNRNQGVLNARAQFFQPSGIAEAGDGSLIVADFGNNRVKVVTIAGITTNLYGVSSIDWWTGTTSGGGTAYLGWSDGTVWEPDGGPGFGNVQARMPFGVAIGPDGKVYTTEDYYHIIREVTVANIAPPPPWPPAPPGMAAMAGYGRVALTWNASLGATNYNVKRSITNGVETTIAGTTGTSYSDTNLLDGTTYYYAVSALNVGGEGQNSTEVSATPLFSPAPTNLTVTATNFGLISLSWSPSTGATSYNLKRAPAHGGPYALIANTASTAYNDTAVFNGAAYYYIVSAVNPGGENPTPSAEVSATVPIPPPPSPVIGWFDYEGTAPPVTVFHPVSGTAFITHNDLSLAIEPSADGVATYYTDDGSAPGPTNGTTPPPYSDGLTYAQPLPVTAAPDVTIKAVNVNAGGDSSPATTEFLFQVANPTVLGNNAAQFTVSDITADSQLWYTTDGTLPTNGAPSLLAGTITSTNAITLSIPFPANTNLMTVTVRGFRDGYSASGNAVQTFSSTNFSANKISFGFASGEASSDFVASSGQTFYAPVTLTMLPNTSLYSLQFNVTVNGASPNQVFGFQSMLMKPIPNTKPVIFEPIPPAMFTAGQSVPNPITLDGSSNFSSLLTVNNSINLLGVGWVERAGHTNLYDTTKQTLITYSLAHDDLFPNDSRPNDVIVGGYSFNVPTGATNGQTYQIQIGRPSATSDGIGTPGSSVFIDAPTNGSLTGGAINSIKNITVGSRRYLVGNAYPFRWFNAGDFGNTNLQNADVEQVFESAIYGLNTPPSDSDFFDSMDSCGNVGALDQDPADANFNYYTNAATYPYPFTYTTTNYTYTDDINTNTIAVTSEVFTHAASIYMDSAPITAYYTLTTNAPTFTNVVTLPGPTYSFPNIYVPNLFGGNDQNINQIAFGDGQLDVCDVYVTFRRSLDTNSLVWFQRFWTNNVRVAVANPAPVIESMAHLLSGGKALALYAALDSVTNVPVVNFTAGDFQAAAGQTVQIPVTAAVFGPYPLRVAMLNISVVPLDGSPALTTPISFSPGVALGVPYMTDSDGPENFAAAWLNSAIAGIPNTATIGTLTVTIPANATSLSAYAIHFDHASASPNGLASFPKHTQTGLITLSSRANSSYTDGIPDSWRLRWFGTANNLLSVSNACPSGDGVNNWRKYVAGVDPNVAGDFPSTNPLNPAPPGSAMSIYWPTVSGKQYAVLSSASLFPGNWNTNAIVTGNGANMEYDDQSGGAVKFYRVQILP